MTFIMQIPCGAYQANAYLLYAENRSDALIIDPGDDINALTKAIDQSGRRLTDILLTHGHFDHMLSAAALREKYDALVHVHPSDAYMLADAGASLYDKNACSQPFAPVTADELYPEDDRFSLTAAGIAFEGIHTPGHTLGGVTLICEDAQSVFTGDTIFAHGYGRFDFPGGDMHQLMKSLKTILGLPRTLTLRPGHGECDSLDAVAARWRL